MKRTAMWIAAPAFVVGVAYGTDVIACGCFARPAPDVDILQAGELVVFAERDGKVTMQVQISYSGPAENFAWLLPVPAEPELSIGAEELFLELDRRTQPTFNAQIQFARNCGGANARDGAAGRTLDGGVQAPPAPEIEVSRQFVGPYEAVVVDASNREDLTAWLNANGFFVADPDGTALEPYVRPGAYFLALKLQSDRTSGDIAPIVLEFDAAMPMIPISLTRVGATPDMPIYVWVLGEARAIPRNFRNVVINMEHIDWLRGGSNYQRVVTRAVDEAEGHHAFVTEFAGRTSQFDWTLAPIGRFGSSETLETVTDAADFTTELRRRNFPWRDAMVNVLRDTFPFPPGVASAGVPENIYYAGLDFYLTTYRDQFPEQFEGADFSFDPVEVTARLWEEIVQPMKDGHALLEAHPHLTRLFTTLSPDEMSLDPAFSFNPDLPDVSNVHTAEVTLECDGTGEVVLPDGRVRAVDEVGDAAIDRAPAARRIEILMEEGPAQVEVDNEMALMPMNTLDGSSLNRSCGCSTTNASGGGAALLLLLVMGLGVRRRR